MEVKRTDAQVIELAIKQIFAFIGEDANRAGLTDTPKRMMRMWGEIFRGYDPTKRPQVTTFDNGEDGVCYQDIIFDNGTYHSVCEHHFLPFFGNYVFAYIPNPKGKVIGLSKIARLIDYHAAKLQIQERLVSDVVSDIERELSKGTEHPPLGVALLMQGEHLCKTMRGVKKQGTMTTIETRGVFKEGEKRKEFLDFAKQCLRNGKV